MSDQYDGPRMAQYLIKLQAKADALQKTIDEKRDQCQEIIKLRAEVERLKVVAEWVPELRGRITQLKAEVEALRTTIYGIAHAKRFDREWFRDDSEFADWAQSLCRHLVVRPTNI